MTPCPTLPVSRQLADQLQLTPEELREPECLGSLLDAVRAVPDPRTALSPKAGRCCSAFSPAARCAAPRPPGALGDLLGSWARRRGAGRAGGARRGRRPAAGGHHADPGPLARADGDALDTAIGVFLQEQARDPHAELAGDAPVLSLTVNDRPCAAPRTARASNCTCWASASPAPA